MAKRKFIFKGGPKELTLPVTPESYQVEKGNNIEVVNIHELGDAILVGYGTLATVKISCIFPARSYPFARDDDPDEYIEQFEKWIKKKSKLRFVVSGTGVNVPVVVQSFSYGERDGTNDIYADIILREYKALGAVKVANTAASKPRAAATKSEGVKTHTAEYGDCLCAICRKYYGDGSYAMAQRLAAYNNRPNPNILYVGEVLKIPIPLV